MENTNTVSIPLVDVLSELTGKRVIMSGDDYVFFENLEKVSQDKIDEAMILKEQKEKELSVPSSITRLQAKLQLSEIGKFSQVEALVQQDEKAKIYWSDASNFLRTDATLLYMASMLGLSDEDLDNLFIAASKK